LSEFHLAIYNNCQSETIGVLTLMISEIAVQNVKISPLSKTLDMSDIWID